MRFPRQKSFDPLFSKVQGARWYPYVGKDFGSQGRRIMVYAHNIPIKPEDYEMCLEKWRDPWCWANCIEEYTYVQGWWTEAFRFFVKAAAGLAQNYTANSPNEVTEKVDSFVHKIAYINFIQDLVKSDSQMANASPDQIETSKHINREFLKILGVTHCICWGKPTYLYMQSIQGARLLQEQNEGKRGFSSSVLDLGFGSPIHLLRIYHPSMPSYLDPFSDTTHQIIRRFLERKPMQ